MLQILSHCIYTPPFLCPVVLGPERHLGCFCVFVVVQPLSHVGLFATPWRVAHQAPVPMGFPRQEYWSGLPLPSPFHILATVNNTWCEQLPVCRQECAVCAGMEVSSKTLISFLLHVQPEVGFWIMVVFFVIFRRSSYCFHSGSPSLHSHRQCMKVPFSPHPQLHLSSLIFLMRASLTS